MSKIVLIIDESRAARAIIEKVMKDAGWDCVQADSLKQAQDQLSKCTAQLFIIDQSVAENDARAVLTEVRKLAAHQSTPAMVTMTQDREAEGIRYLAAGFADFLLRPFTSDQLLEKLKVMGV